MKKVIELNEKCKSCKGTGLYMGMWERDGAAVVCHDCKGTGCHQFRHEYEDFQARVARTNVKRVYEYNPGVCIGEGRGIKLEDFGGLPVANWEAGVPFSPGTEDRLHSCPAWWYQSVNYDLKPKWDTCIRCGCFSDCVHFSDKAQCWKRWDKENGHATPSV